MRPRDYLELEKLARTVARKSGEPWTRVFDCPSVGFLLREQQGPHGSGPINSDCFALSGTAQFSFLSVPGRPVEKSPVVMTVPLAAEQAHHVLGADLREFLSLGIKSGYAVLSQLGHSEKAAHNAIVRGLLKSEDKRPDLRALLIDRFALKPWTRIAERLLELRTEFSPHLVLAKKS